MDINWFKKLFINEAKPALDRHSDSDPTVVPLTATDNGTHTPPDGVNGYSPVIVAVPEYDGETGVIE